MKKYFKDEAESIVKATMPFDTKAVIINYLLENALGHENAKPWNMIDLALKVEGVNISKAKFQQTILKDSRKSSMFIGSNDHGIAKGYFIINSLKDAQVMLDWYKKRIKVETERKDHLELLITESFK